MSRIGKRPVNLAKGVTASIANGVLTVKGPKGLLTLDVSEARYPVVQLAIDGESITVTRRQDNRAGSTQQGLLRALIQNMATGVSEGFTRTLEIVGVGYRAEAKGSTLNLSLGFSHPVEFALPKGIDVAVEKQTRVTISGSDRQLVGETAARIRRLRPPEPYKGKGVRYSDEVVRRKVGKAAAGTGG